MYQKTGQWELKSLEVHVLNNIDYTFLTEDGLYEVLILSRKTMAIEYDCKSKNSLTFTILYVIMYI